MQSVPLPFLSKITLLWTRAREPGPVSPVKVDSPLPFPWTQRGEIYILAGKQKNMCIQYEDEAVCKRRYDSLRAFRKSHQQQKVFDLYRRENCIYILRLRPEPQRKAS